MLNFYLFWYNAALLLDDVFAYLLVDLSSACRVPLSTQYLHIIMFQSAREARRESRIEWKKRAVAEIFESSDEDGDER